MKHVIMWHKTVMSELKEMGLTRGGMEKAAQDWIRWRRILAALCPTSNKEDE